MKSLWRMFSFGLVLIGLFAFEATAGVVKVGENAPNFVGTDSLGKSHNLADYRGKYVVLEWHGYHCPWTLKFYGSGAMQDLQREWTAKGVVWLSILSDRVGSESYRTPDSENAYLAKVKAAPTAAIMDPDGAIGHLYNAQSTLHMIVISPEGKVVYNGAIDDHPTNDPKDIPKSKNYVSAALSESMAGKPVAVAASHPYGCWIRYKNGDGGSALPIVTLTK